MSTPTECNDNDSPWLLCKTCAADGKCARNTRTEFEAAAYRYICANSATYPSLKVPIQLIVQETSILHSTHGQVGYRKGLDTHFAAAMGWPAVPEVKS